MLEINVPTIKIKAMLADICATVVNTKNSMNVNNLHKILDHCGEANRKGFGLRGLLEHLTPMKHALPEKQSRKTSINSGKVVVLFLERDSTLR
jgi:hypothetical protein